MTKKGRQPPEQVILSAKETEELKDRIEKNELSKQDIKLLLGLVSFNLWLQERLSRAKLTIKRLRQLFGFKNESRKKKKNKDDDNSSEESSDNSSGTEGDDDANIDASDDNASQNSGLKKAPQWDDTQNHGRMAANDYTGCDIITVPFEDELLKQGQCPKCAACDTKASVLPEDPSILVFLEGRPLISGQRYQLEKGRCTLCGTYFTAPLPKALEGRSKYSNSCITNIAIYHYYAGLPFNRIEMLQSVQGVPLPDSTQYDYMNKLYTDVVDPVVSVLRAYAANGTRLYFDDTTGRILDQITYNKTVPAKDAKAVHATAMLSDYEGHRIYLFDTNTLPAGQQLSALFKERTSAETFATMSDASASNFPVLEDCLAAHWVISLCLTHGRRRFFELLGDGDEEIALILDIIAQVYQNEHYCKQHALDDQQRLAYHQQHSASLMEALRIWFNNVLVYKQVEPNSRLGEAILHMLKRWYWFTQFLRVPGVAIDNNACECAIKVLIRYRNNSLFYKTFYGACVGDAIMSLLHTAACAGINIFDYCNTLQHYQDHVQSAPHEWLPWNYQQTITDRNPDAEPRAINSS